MSTLERAIRLAMDAHEGQVDKGGSPYILHPLRVMFRMQTTLEMMAAVLHDVVEDSTFTILDLQSEGFPGEVLEAVECLTRKKDESYEDFVKRIAPNSLARRVKLGDLEDNMDIRRIPELKDNDVERLRRYRLAWKQLYNLNHIPQVVHQAPADQGMRREGL